jgi:amino acid transporter
VPASGGSFEYLKVAYHRTPLGRLLPFLFIWQFILSGPLEVASGNIGFANYLSYMLPLSGSGKRYTAVAVGLLAVLLLYRRIESVGKLMVALWAGVLLTLGVVLACGLPHFRAQTVFDFPPHAFTFSQGFLLGLGSAMLVAMYDFLGYYSVCYIGGEVRNPSRTIPRSILISVVVVAAVYLSMNISLISVLPWREAMKSQFIASEFMERLYGRAGGVLMTLLICWTAFASVFALMLAYSRIPYAAARDGFFFSAFAKLHPRGDFPHVSLLVLGSVAVASSFFPLDEVISALITTRILVQFIGQIGALALLRRLGSQPGRFRMALYPLPALVALGGWTYIFATSGKRFILIGLATLAAGVIAYGAWDKLSASRRRLEDEPEPGREFPREKQA